MLTKLFRKPTASERAAQELHAAKLDRLQAQAAAEYWKHQCAMLDERIARLECAAGGVGGAGAAVFTSPLTTVRGELHAHTGPVIPQPQPCARA